MHECFIPFKKQKPFWLLHLCAISDTVWCRFQFCLHYSIFFVWLCWKDNLKAHTLRSVLVVVPFLPIYKGRARINLVRVQVLSVPYQEFSVEYPYPVSVSGIRYPYPYPVSVSGIRYPRFLPCLKLLLIWIQTFKQLLVKYKTILLVKGRALLLNGLRTKFAMRF